MNVSSSVCLFQIFFVYTMKMKVEVKHSASNKDILHMKIKRSTGFEGVTVQLAFLGLCCICND